MRNKRKNSLNFKEFLEARTGFEPVIRVLQTHALPLGYRAATKLLYKKKCQKAINFFLSPMTPTGIEPVLPP